MKLTLPVYSKHLPLFLHTV